LSIVEHFSDMFANSLNIINIIYPKNVLPCPQAGQNFHAFEKCFDFVLFFIQFLSVYQKLFGHAPPYTYKTPKTGTPTLLNFRILLPNIYRYPRETMKFRVHISTS